MNDDRYDIILQYLNGGMDDNRKMVFEQEMLADKELEEDVSILQRLQKTLKENEAVDEREDELNKSLSEISTSFFKTDVQVAIPVSRPAKRMRIEFISKWTWLAAACVIGIIVLGAMWFLNQEQPNQPTAVNSSNNNGDSNKKEEIITAEKDVTGEGQLKPDFKKLFAENFEKDKIPEEGTEGIQYALAQYQRGKYADALYAFNAAKNDVSVRGASGDSLLTAFYINYYSALSFMLNNETAKAIPLLENASQHANDKFLQAKSTWYLSLAHIKSGNAEKAKPLLIKLTSDKATGIYKNKADSLLIKLGK